MFVDSQTLLWSAAALTTTAVSTNGYDLGADAVTSATRRDPTIGEPLCVVISVGVAALVVGTETYEFDTIQADDDALTSNVQILTQYPFTTAQATTLLKAGAIIVLPFAPGSITKRYIGAKYVSANSAGITVTAWITSMKMVQQTRAYGTKIVVL